MGTPRRHLMLAAALVASVALNGCGTSGASSDGSAPRGGGGSSTGYVPASGTDATGILFPPYTSKSAGYSFVYPGGWRVVEKPPASVRISRFGNAITAVVT